MEYIPRGNRYPCMNKHGVHQRSLERLFQIRSDSEQLSFRVRSDLCIEEFLLMNTDNFHYFVIHPGEGIYF